LCFWNDRFKIIKLEKKFARNVATFLRKIVANFCILLNFNCFFKEKREIFRKNDTIFYIPIKSSKKIPHFYLNIT
jgi:hypothetical protein